MFRLPLPPSINSYYSQSWSGHRFKTKQARDWEEEAGILLLKHKKYGKKKICLDIDFYFKNDLSDRINRVKILEDLLEKMGIVDNDRQIYAGETAKYIDKNDPRCEIHIKQLEKDLK